MEITMDIYRRRAGKRDEEGVMQYAAPAKYIDAASFLSHQPKFSDLYSDGKS